MTIPFNIPCITGREIDRIKLVLAAGRFSGDGHFTNQCHQWFDDRFAPSKTLMTTSCTHALEMSAILSDISPGDEVIMPSFSFSSTANAVVMRGAKPVFVDIRPDTMNIDEAVIESAVSEKTRALVVVHYAGVACEMESICAIAKKYNLVLIEDAAHAFLSKYQDRYLGTIGDFGCFSFHESKNIHCGEGGALVVNDLSFFERAEIIREKGLNIRQFLKGEVDRYQWNDIGSSYLPSELNAAFLSAQLSMADVIFSERMNLWNEYRKCLEHLAFRGLIDLPVIPEKASHNAHIFYVKADNLAERDNLIRYLKEKGISAVFHYLPLHSAIAGKQFGEFRGEDRYTTKESERLIRLPLFYGMGKESVSRIGDEITRFFRH